MTSWDTNAIQNHTFSSPDNETAKLGKTGPGPTEFSPSARAMIVPTLPTT